MLIQNPFARPFRIRSEQVTPACFIADKESDFKKSTIIISPKLVKACVCANITQSMLGGIPGSPTYRPLGPGSAYSFQKGQKRKLAPETASPEPRAKHPPFSRLP